LTFRHRTNNTHCSIYYIVTWGNVLRFESGKRWGMISIKLCFSSSGTHRCQYLCYLVFILKYQCFVFMESYVNIMTCPYLISRAIRHVEQWRYTFMHWVGGGVNDLSDKLWYAKITVFWLVIQCGLVDMCWCSRSTTVRLNCGM
jgi:hypothetical protein